MDGGREEMRPRTGAWRSVGLLLVVGARAAFRGEEERRARLVAELPEGQADRSRPSSSTSRTPCDWFVVSQGGPVTVVNHGSYANGRRHGVLSTSLRAGGVSGGPYVQGQRQGRWVPAGSIGLLTWGGA